MPGQMNFSRGYGSKRTKCFSTLRRKSILWITIEIALREPDGRYSVSLPKRIPQPRLGDSRQLALKRYYSNEKSLQKKGTWEQFQSVEGVCGVGPC